MSTALRTEPGKTEPAVRAERASGRRSPRRIYRRPVGVLVAGRYQVLEGRNLSEGGVLIALPPKKKIPKPDAFVAEDLAVGSSVAISLILPAGSSIVLRGEIIYGKVEEGSGYVFGIKFDTVALHHRREIRNYVSSKQAGEAEP